MAPSTTNRMGRTSTSRAGRSSTSRPTGRFARSTATPRRSTPTQGLRRRRQPQPTGIKKVLGAVLPTSAAKKAAPSSKKGKAGGLALAAAAAGVAFKNRDKLAQLTHKNGQTDDATTASSGTNNAATPPATPTV